MSAIESARDIPGCDADAAPFEVGILFCAAVETGTSMWNEKAARV